jgi:hypothetical protein
MEDMFMMAMKMVDQNSPNKKEACPKSSGQVVLGTSASEVTVQRHLMILQFLHLLATHVIKENAIFV